MVEFGGFQLGTIFQGAQLAAIIVAFFTALGIWIKHGPERVRAKNEGKVIDNAEYARQRIEDRKEVHVWKNRTAAVEAEQHLCKKGLIKAHVVIHQITDQNINMLSLIELLISDIESERPESIVASQARLLLKQMRAAANRKVDPFINNPHQSDALNASEHAVEATEEAQAAAVATHKEVEKKEGNGK